MFKNLSLKWQLGVGFALAAGMFMVTLLLIGGQLALLREGVRRVDEISLPLILAVDEMDLSRSEVQQFLTDVAATHDAEGYREAEAAAERFTDATQRVRTLLTGDGQRERLAALAAIEASFTAFNDSGRHMAEAYLRDGIEAGNRLMKGSDGKPGFDQASEAIAGALTAFRRTQLELSRADATADLHAANAIQRAIVWGGLIASALAAAAAVLVVRAILDCLGGEPREAVRIAQRVGEGRLDTPITLVRGDDHSLMAHLKRMQDGLIQVVGTVRRHARGVEATSAEIEHGSTDLASRTMQQNEALETTAASMEELSTSVQHSVDGARQINGMAGSASTSASQAGALVARFVDTMSGIDEASHKIADIIGVIDGIAFQTNLLALNAAVEAARAGTQGRGFAVVASEVRSLAKRSAEAAKAVKALISDSVERVGQGTLLVAEARATMDQVVAGIAHVSRTMDEITTTQAQQSAGVASMAEAMQQIGQVTQQNGSLVEDSSRAAARLRRQAAELTCAVAVFTLARDDDALAASAGLPAASIAAVPA